MADPTVAPVAVEPGWKTTEFWATVAGSLVAILNQAFGWHIPQETIITVISGIATYVLGRSIVKKQPPVTP